MSTSPMCIKLRKIGGATAMRHNPCLDAIPSIRIASPPPTLHFYIYLAGIAALSCI